MRKTHSTVDHSRLARAGALAIASLAIVTAACTSGARGADGASIDITTPAPDVRTGRSFDVVLDATTPLGDPDTGRHHVHLYLDNSPDYDITYFDRHRITGLDTGPHSLIAVLANADHSETDTRAQVDFEVTTDGSGDVAESPTAAPDTIGGHGY